MQAEFLSLAEIRINQNSKLDSYDNSQPNNSLTVHLPEDNSAELLSIFIPQSDNSSQISVHEIPIYSKTKAHAKKIESSDWEDFLVMAVRLLARWKIILLTLL